MGYLRSKVMNFGAILIPSIVSLRDHSLVEQNISFNSKHCQSAHEGHGLVHTTDVFLTISSVSWFTESQSTLSRSHLLLPLQHIHSPTYLFLSHSMCCTRAFEGSFDDQAAIFSPQWYVECYLFVKTTGSQGAYQDDNQSLVLSTHVAHCPFYSLVGHDLQLTSTLFYWRVKQSKIIFFTGKV